MYLDEIVRAQKRGLAWGIPSICSSHPFILKQALKIFEHPLVEATCNQVNQYGGYTGLTPAGYVGTLQELVQEAGLSWEKLILGGDHLGPNVWKHEPAESAMQKSEVLVRDFVKAGFLKIHLDCSMNLADDPQSNLSPELVARRTARLVKIAEETVEERSRSRLRFVIGTEVPVPGGATEHEETVPVTKVETVKETIESHRRAFYELGLQSAWERVIAVVVQPGVEFGDDFVLPYQPQPARELSCFIESQPMVYEAHSTDYQTCEAMKELVRDHFAILKVGPSLTFAFREAVFALAMMEAELFPAGRRSNLVHILDVAMEKYPDPWKRYYRGSKLERNFKRKYSLSDRARYYWARPEVKMALGKLMSNLGERPLPRSLLSQFVGEVDLTAKDVIETKIGRVLRGYQTACGEIG